jgi:hypothetical protein
MSNSSENKFTRLFKDRAIDNAKAKPKVRIGGSRFADAIAQAVALAPADDVIDAEVIDVPAAIAPAEADEAAVTPAIAPAATDADTDAITPTIPVEQPAATAVTAPIHLAPTPHAKLKPPTPDEPRRGRGRPATGKRSDPGWRSRTFYIRNDTDDRLERALLQLKHNGYDVDKSQLTDTLLNAWAAVKLDEYPDFQIGEILKIADADGTADTADQP